VVGNLIEVVKKASGDPKAAAGLERMSPEMRANISKGVAKLYELGLISGSPDLPEEWPFSTSEQAPSWNDSEIRPSKPIIQSPSAIQEDTGPRWLLAVVILVGVSLCVAGVAAYIILGQGL
jgi:hypothetical protein